MDKKNFKEILSKCFGKEKDERYHAIAMLALYGLFFFTVILIIRTSPTSTNDEKVTDSPTNNPTNNIVDDNNKNQNKDNLSNESFDINYSYVYTLENNGVKEVFTGKRLDDKEIFTYITSTGSTDYARLSDNYLIKENGEYHLVDIPSPNLKYTDMDKIVSLTEKASLAKEGNIYKYSVPVSEVLTMYDSDRIAEATLYDNIIVTLENEVIKTIDINFTNYASIINGNVATTLTIKMEFNNVGTTENFDVTVSN